MTPWTLPPSLYNDPIFIPHHSVPFHAYSPTFWNVLCFPVYKTMMSEVSFLTRPCTYIFYIVVSFTLWAPLPRIPQPLLASPYLKQPPCYRRSSLYNRYCDYLLCLMKLAPLTLHITTFTVVLYTLYKVTHPPPEEPAVCHTCALYCVVNHQLHIKHIGIQGKLDNYWSPGHTPSLACTPDFEGPPRLPQPHTHTLYFLSW